jgi:hypothetical protein
MLQSRRQGPIRSRFPWDNKKEYAMLIGCEEEEEEEEEDNNMLKRKLSGPIG